MCFSGENTKFIVTLEGMDSEVFPEKEETLSIRSRLGARPPPADTEDQVEVRRDNKYIYDSTLSYLSPIFILVNTIHYHILLYLLLPYV